MIRDAKILRIVLASLGDVSVERETVRKVLDELNKRMAADRRAGHAAPIHKLMDAFRKFTEASASKARGTFK